MATYYEDLQLKIKNNKRELDRLNLEKRALFMSRRAWSEENYKKEEASIQDRIESIQKSIKRDQELLASYDLSKNYMEDIKYLNKMYNAEDNNLYREKIANEIIKRKEIIDEKINSNLPEKLKEEISTEYKVMDDQLEDKKLARLEEEQRVANIMLNSANDRISKYTDNIMNIFNEERKELEEKGPFTTEEELDRFNERYMIKKIAQNDLLESAKKRKRELENLNNSLNRKIEDRKVILKESKKVNISPDDYANIKASVEKRDKLEKLFNRYGLKELKEKRDKLSLMSEDEISDRKQKVLNELVKEKQEQNKRATKKALPSDAPIIIKDNNDSEITTEDIKKSINNKLDEINTTKVKEENIDYGYKTVIAKLVEGLTPKKKDGQRYRAANIKVTDEFKNELHSGNYLYNIVHVVPAIIKLPIQTIRKFIGKITYREEAKNRMETIRRRLDNLSEKDLMILFKEYGNHAREERFGTGINLLINERINRFVYEKVNSINKGLETKYQDLFNTMKEMDTIDSMIRSKDTDESTRENLKLYRASILKGKAKEVESIRNDYDEAKTLLSSGLHGFSENLRATESKMSYVGRRFAKDHDLDVELLEKEAKYEKAEKRAIQDGNDEMALRIFIANETLLSKNTKIENSIVGKRSTGKKYYSPLVESLDYRNDPFIRDIFTTIAVVGATVTAVNAINASKAKVDYQKQIDEVNAHNEKVMESVNNTGNIISNKKRAYMEGMKAENYQDSLNISNVLERKALDQSSEVHGGWSVGTQSYYDARSIAQGSYVDFYNNTKNAIADVTTKYSTGQLSGQQAIDALGEISKNSQTTLRTVVNEALPHLNNYARDHSQFDLSGIKDAMNYIVENPDAITNMNKAMIETTELGEELAKMSIEKVNLINELPNNISAPLFGAATAASLAMNVANTAGATKKGAYGNKITNIVDQYLDYQEALERKNNNRIR